MFDLYTCIKIPNNKKIKKSIINILNFQALRLSGSAKKATTVGEILNLMSVDAQKLQVRHHQGLQE